MKPVTAWADAYGRDGSRLASFQEQYMRGQRRTRLARCRSSSAGP